MSKCPEHNRELFYRRTRYGPRGECLVAGCTVVHWRRDTTATPANYETRQARRKAHSVFDILWQSKKYERGSLYKKLSQYLGLKIKQMHIGQFNIEQCQETVKFVRLIEEQE